MTSTSTSWDSLAEKHIGHRTVLRDARTLECVDCSHKLLLPREPRVVTVTSPAPYKAPDPTPTASAELIALRKREVAAALEAARLKRTTVVEPS